MVSGQWGELIDALLPYFEPVKVQDCPSRDVGVEDIFAVVNHYTLSGMPRFELWNDVQQDLFF